MSTTWSSWIPLLIHSIISIISIHFLYKLCSRITKNVNNQIQQQQTSTNDKPIGNNKDTQQLCERCANILASSAAKKQQKNYQNNNQIKYKTFDDESYRRQLRLSAIDGETERRRQSSDGSSSDGDHQNIVDQVVSTREVISYDRPNENNKKILEVCHTTNSVSRLRKQFENVENKKSIRNLERQISEKFFKSSSPTSPKRPTSRNDVDEMIGTEQSSVSSSSSPSSTNDYYVIEKTKVYKVVNNGKIENAKGVERPSSPLPPAADKKTKLILSKRSHSNGDIKRLKRSPSHDVIAEEPFVLNERTKSMEQMTEDSDDIEYRRISTATNGDRRTVRTVDDILQQERFSKCYSEYSISDLLNDLPDDDESAELALFFNKIK